FNDQIFYLTHIIEPPGEGILYISLEEFNEVFHCNSFVEKKLSTLVIDCQITFPTIQKIIRQRTRELYRDDTVNNYKFIKSEKKSISGPFVDFNLTNKYSLPEDQLTSDATISSIWGTP